MMKLDLCICCNIARQRIDKIWSILHEMVALGISWPERVYLVPMGQPRIVAFCCEERLLSSPRLKEKEPSGLKSMAIQLEKCLAMLKDIGKFATLNSFGTIQKLTYKFPEEMKRDWVKWSFNVLKKSGKQAKFEELVEFVRHESEKANFLYGRALYTTAKSSSLRPSFKKTSVFGTVANSNVKMKTIVSKKQCSF